MQKLSKYSTDSFQKYTDETYQYSKTSIKIKKKIGMEKLYHKRNVLKREIVNVKIVESIPIIDEKTKI